MDHARQYQVDLEDHQDQLDQDYPVHQRDLGDLRHPFFLVLLGDHYLPFCHKDPGCQLRVDQLDQRNRELQVDRLDLQDRQDRRDLRCYVIIIFY